MCEEFVCSARILLLGLAGEAVIRIFCRDRRINITEHKCSRTDLRESSVTSRTDLEFEFSLYVGGQGRGQQDLREVVCSLPRTHMLPCQTEKFRVLLI